MAEGDPMVGKRDQWRGDLITISKSDESKPTLYHADMSYYSQIGIH